jgi:ubiquinone/menaquinone biosynthesis C-methylase UbiE
MKYISDTNRIKPPQMKPEVPTHTSFSAGASFYDAIYAAEGKNYASEVEYVRRVIQKLQKSTGSRLLETACGTGCHTQHFLNHFEVVGLDKSREMLAIARRRLPGVCFYEADMVDFDLGGRFDAVICLFSSIGYVRKLEQFRQAIQTMSKHLLPGGVLVMEPWLTPEEFLPGKVFATFVDQPELKIARMNVNVLREGMSILDFNYLVCTPEGVTHFSEHHELGLFTHEDYLAAFRDSGLEATFDPPGVIARGLYLGIR